MKHKKQNFASIRGKIRQVKFDMSNFTPASIQSRKSRKFGRLKLVAMVIKDHYITLQRIKLKNKQGLKCTTIINTTGM